MSGSGLRVLNAQFPEVLDASMLSDAADCFSKFYHRHVLGLRPIGEVEDNNLSWGTAWHNFQYWRNTHGSDVAFERLRAMPWSPTLDFSDKHNRTHERMLSLAEQYIERWSEADKRITPLRNEQFFDIYCPKPNPHCPFRWKGCGLRWSGRIDRTVRELKTRDIVWDYKTSSRLVSNYWERYQHSFQIPGYVWAASHLTGRPVWGARLDVLYTLKASEDFFRRPFRYTEDEIESWLADVKYYEARLRDLFASAAENPDKWPRNRNNCTMYGRNCYFTDVHIGAASPDERNTVLRTQYQEDRWDPAAAIEAIE